MVRHSPSLARMIRGWIGSLRSPMDTFWLASWARTAASRLVSTYIRPLGSWSPKRFSGMLTLIDCTSYERAGAPAGHTLPPDEAAEEIPIAVAGVRVTVLIAVAAPSPTTSDARLRRRAGPSRHAIARTERSRTATGSTTTSTLNASPARVISGSPGGAWSSRTSRSWFPDDMAPAATGAQENPVITVERGV